MKPLFPLSLSRHCRLFVSLCFVFVSLTIPTSFAVEPLEEKPAVASEKPQAVEKKLSSSILTPVVSRAVIDEGWFTEEELAENLPVTRALFARSLVRTMGFDTVEISPFPFYRDLPNTHPDYAAIEVLREKRLFVPDNHGYFSPNQFVHRAEVMGAIADILTGRNIPKSEVLLLLQDMTDMQNTSVKTQQSATKLLRARIFPDQDLSQKTLRPNATLNTQNLAYWLVHLRERYQRDWLKPKPVEVMTQVPEGTSFTVSPTASLFAEQHPLGSTIYWALVNPVVLPDGTKIPEGTRIRSTVVSFEPSEHSKASHHPTRISVTLTEAKAPEGHKYKLNGHLKLDFPKRQGGSYIVPGEVYSMITQP